MTGVQTCALPICFPVTILMHDESQMEGDYDSPIDYHYPVFDGSAYWVKDLNYELLMIEAH